METKMKYYCSECFEELNVTFYSDLGVYVDFKCQCMIDDESLQDEIDEAYCEGESDGFDQGHCEGHADGLKQGFNEAAALAADLKKDKEMTQRIVCAAIKHTTDEIIIGPRHFDRVMNTQIKKSDFLGWSQADQGFVDQFGTFLTREEALEIAVSNGQIIRRVGGDEKELFSENLY